MTRCEYSTIQGQVITQKEATDRLAKEKQRPPRLINIDGQLSKRDQLFCRDTVLVLYVKPATKPTAKGSIKKAAPKKEPAKQTQVKKQAAVK